MSEGNNDRIPLTDDMIERLRTLRSETRISLPNLVRLYPECPMSEATLRNWCLGQAKTVPRHRYDQVVALYERIGREQEREPECFAWLDRRLSKGDIVLTPDVIAALRDLWRRAGRGWGGWNHRPRAALPVNRNTVRRWMNGEVCAADSTKYEAVVAVLRAEAEQRRSEAAAAPRPAPPSARDPSAFPDLAPLTPNMVARLRALRCETRISASNLVRLYPECPVSAATVKQWCLGKAKSVPRSRYDDLVALYERIRDEQKREPERFTWLELRLSHGDTVLTPAMVAELRDLWGRSGRTKGKRGSAPLPVRAATAHRWMNGEAAMVYGAKYAALIARLRADAERHQAELARKKLKQAKKRKVRPQPKPPLPPKPPTTIRFTRELRTQLLGELQRCGMTPLAFVERHAGAVEWPLEAQLTGWLDGTIRSAERDHLDEVFDRLRRLPTAATRFDSGRRRLLLRDAALREPGEACVAIAPELVERMRSEKIRTRMGARQLFRKRADMPEGLTAAMVNRWLDGRLTEARHDHVEYVLRCWAETTDAVPITPAIRRRLRIDLALTGCRGWKEFLDRNQPHPDELTSLYLGRWTDGTTKYVRRDLLTFVFDRLKAMQKKAIRDREWYRSIIGDHPSTDRPQ